MVTQASRSDARRHADAFQRSAMREACRMKLARCPVSCCYACEDVAERQDPDHGFRVPSFTRLLPHLQEPTLHHCDSDSLPIIWP